MAKTPWEMAEVGKEFSHQSALLAWAAMARQFGPNIANDPGSYKIAGEAKKAHEAYKLLGVLGKPFAAPIPELKWLHAIKNQGHGDRIRGSRSAAEGVRSGVFDVFLPVSRLVISAPTFEGWRNIGGFCAQFGLYLELKKPGKFSVSEAQEDFQRDMRAAGYAAEIVIGWEAARDCLLTYLGKSPA